MRLLVCGLLLAGIASPAFGADVDNSWLRGSSSFPADPPTYRRWSGFYGGGQIGLDFHSIQFNDNGNAMVATLVAAVADPILDAAGGAPTLGDLARRNTRGLSYGGFVGYNYQIDDIVLGLELNFNSTGISASTGGAKAKTGTCPPSPPSPPIPGGDICQITVNTSNAATGTLADYGTVRVRGGWAYGSFLPYVVVGVAVGWVNSVQTVNVSYSEDDITAGTNIKRASYTDTAVNHGKTAFGFSAGLGVDYILYQNVFLRGEFEYLQFGAVGTLNVNAMSVRTGLGMKF